MTDDDRGARAVIPESVTETAERYRYSPGIVVPAGRRSSSSRARWGGTRRARSSSIPSASSRRRSRTSTRSLAAAGTSLAHVVELTTYHTAMEHLALFAEVKSRFLTTTPYPAWSAIGVQELALPGLLVEIKATATL